MAVFEGAGQALSSPLDNVTSRAIDLIEAAYDLRGSDADWLAQLVKTAEPILDRGLGLFGFAFLRPAPGGGGADAVVRHMHTRSLPADFPERFDSARRLISPELIEAAAPPGYAGTWTQLLDGYPEVARAFLEKLGYSDLLGVLAVDPNGVGVHMSAPLPRATRLSKRSRERWQMLGAHIASAYRLRLALKEPSTRRQVDSTRLPHDAEAVFDANGFHVVDAVGPAKEPTVASVLRDASRAIDRARGELREANPHEALETWKALVSGRWSMVDWFDSDGRRFFLAIPNPPDVRDPRGLTEQERQVVAYVLLGETGKLIAYRLGLSPGRVSRLLKSVMHKLGVNSRTQLVRKLGLLGVPTPTDEQESGS
ncbi:MAG: LuxR C-terminal-related transcriptional regulator [Myxococcales bacterium]|nr:LuxR C-terminal-related transcriptional regulator [Myxococcales bacterium]